MKTKSNDTLPVKTKILLVDDDKVFRAEFIDCFRDYDFIEASSGQEALCTLKKANEIDLVILDVRMPGMDGIEVIKRIKDMGNNIGVVILTGFSSKDVAIEALREKADNYIEKPVDIGKTKKIIEEILETRRLQVINEPSRTKEKIERVKLFIRRNCLKKTSLEEAGRVVAMSPKYLSRVFKETTGKSFIEYKLLLKMNLARVLLSKSSLNINQIAQKLSYENPESFSRQFKKIVGVNPAQFRNRIKSRKRQ